MMVKLQQAATRFEALSLRERLLILVTVVVAIALPALLYLIEPAQKQQVRLKTSLAKMEAENAGGILELATLKAKLKADPSKALSQEIASLESQLDSLNQQLQQRAAQLISPQDMLGVLEQVLNAQRKLNLIALEKGAPVPFRNPVEAAAGADGAESTTSSGIYRHDLTLVVEGGYFDTLAYLKALEQLPQGFFWDELDYQVDSYPRARVTLKVHTLSTTAGWLGV
ncbi:hypothetical protein [Motiliproteus sediminis]|uniref:hypothetical protein n=1 Tax=Motiliproteus sediminis TaxID=1468178 RepID=UPI001AEF4556|nr:hypothetical protein [Motiliproteus sediminis]